MTDLLRLDYINSLPQPFQVKLLGGGTWPVYDIEVQIGLVRIDVCGALEVKDISDINYFIDAEGVEHDMHTFFVDYVEEKVMKLNREDLKTGWKQAIDDELILSHLGTADSYNSAKEALHDLCKWHEEVGAYFARESSNRWIRCSERMPELDEEVNVWLDYNRRQVATMRFGGLDECGSPFWFWHNSDDITTLIPKAWQPLPNPPHTGDKS